MIIEPKYCKNYMCPMDRNSPCVGPTCMAWRRQTCVQYKEDRESGVTIPVVVETGMGYCGMVYKHD